MDGLRKSWSHRGNGNAGLITSSANSNKLIIVRNTILSYIIIKTHSCWEFRAKYICTSTSEKQCRASHHNASSITRVAQTQNSCFFCWTSVSTETVNIGDIFDSQLKSKEHIRKFVIQYGFLGPRITSFSDDGVTVSSILGRRFLCSAAHMKLTVPRTRTMTSCPTSNDFHAPLSDVNQRFATPYHAHWDRRNFLRPVFEIILTRNCFGKLPV